MCGPCGVYGHVFLICVMGGKHSRINPRTVGGIVVVLFGLGFLSYDRQT